MQWWEVEFWLAQLDVQFGEPSDRGEE